MSNIVFTPKWNSAINQVESYEPITGGANGNANLANKQLAENVFYLKNEITTISLEVNDTNKKLNTEIAATKSYADTKKTEAINESKTYTDTQDAANLTAAKSYADTKKAEAISTSKSYADTQDSLNLNSAKSYTDTQDAANLTSAKSYADTKKTEAISTSKSYADTADNTVITDLKQFVNTQDATNLTAAKSYADTQDATNLTAAKSYADTKKTEAITESKTYADQKQSISTYTPTFSSLTGITSVTGSNITYIKTDKQVIIFGTLTFNIPAAGNISCKMSLPITSNFTGTNQAGGTILSTDSIHGYVTSGTDKLLLITANSTLIGTAIVAGFNFTYIIV